MKKLFLMMTMAAASLGAAAVENPLWLRDVQISPDGQNVLFCYKGDIYKVAAKGGMAQQLTTQESYECSPVWSSDGQKIAFASDRHGNFDVYVMDADGGQAQRLTYNSAAETPEAFSKDGEWVYFDAQIQDPAASVMFPGSRLPELYRVPTAGGRTEQVLGTPAEMLCFADNGQDFYYQDKKGYEDEWRKHHTSSITRDIWLYEAATGKHTNLTQHAGEDRNPVLIGGELYFLSERDGGTMNVYKTGGNVAKPTKVTNFATHPVRFLSASNEGLLCFTYNGEIYTQRGGESKKLNITLTRDDEEQIANLTFNSGHSQATVSRDGKQVAFICRGEVFATTTEYATTRQISETAGAETGVDFAPDGRSMVYASERNGNWQLYIAKIVRPEEQNFANATLIEEKPIFPEVEPLCVDDTKPLDFSAVERCWPKFSPDGKKVAYIEDRIKLKVVDLQTMEVTEVTDGSKWYDQDGQFGFEWSPDGEWFVLDFIANQRDPYADQGIVSAKGGEIHPITQSGYISGGGRWVMDGKAILFQSNRYGMRSHASWGSQDDVFLAFLTLDAYDRYRLNPEEYAQLKDEEAQAKKKDDDAKKDDKSNAKKDSKGKDKKAAEAKEGKADEKKLEIDFEGIEERVVRLTPNSATLGDAIVDKDGENLYYFAQFEKDMDLWKLDIRKKETKLVSKGAPRGSGSLQMDKDGNLYVMGSGMKKIEKGDNLKPVTYSAKMQLDLAAEREYMYRHMAKQINKKIFRTDYNGCDWEKMVVNYGQFLPHIANNYDFQEMLSEILGELNVSHTGGRYRSAATANSDVTACLGLIYDMNAATDGVRIDEVIEKGPFDKATSKVKAGDVITAINGKALTADTDIAQLLNNQAGKNTLVTLKNEQGIWDEVVKPISAGAQSQLLYKRWVKGRAEAVEKLSNGRLGYVHIESMNDASYRSVYSDILGKFNQKEGIVIDTRHNGGGRLHEDIEVLFSGEHYFYQVIRGRVVCDMPSRRYNHPSIMIQAEGNYSNAHGTPWVYSHQKIGKLVGAPVPGTMSSVNWETMQDPSLVFGVPVIGYQLPDGTYLENTQLEPDILILNDPQTVVEGRDLQLEAAVEELLKSL